MFLPYLLANKTNKKSINLQLGDFASFAVSEKEKKKNSSKIHHPDV